MPTDLRRPGNLAGRPTRASSAAPLRTNAARTTLVPQRAVILEVAGVTRAMWLQLCAEYAQSRKLDIVLVARDITAAMTAIANGAADVLVVPRADMLAPLVHVVHGAPPDGPREDQRRVRRVVPRIDQ